MVVPVVAEGTTVHGVALPVVAKSPAAIPLTFSLKENLNTGLRVPDGDVGDMTVAVGPVVSSETVLDAEEAALVLPA